MDQDIYYLPKEAASELKRRQASGVMQEIEKWWKDKDWPMPKLPVGEWGIIARQVATARYEDLVFAEMATLSGLNPLWIEYTGDIFVTHSKLKRSLLHPFFCYGRGNGGGWRTRKEKNADILACEGRALSDIQARGISLLEYHHSLQDEFIPGALRVDMTNIYKSFRGAKNYYPALLSMFIAHGVLFEDYHGGESGKALDGFTQNIFQPAWEMIVRELGLKPLITPLPWRDGMQYFPAEQNWLEHGVFDKQSIAKLVV